LGRDAVRRLQSPTGWLNDDCINGCLKVLARHFPNEDCAILSSFLMPMVRDATDTNLIVQRLYRTSYRTKYWLKGLWILPVHQQSRKHWGLCTLHFNKGSVQLFDSLGLEEPWQEDLQVRIQFPIPNHLQSFST
jgi:Ulp1 family protease